MSEFAFSIRSYQPEDEDRVVALLRQTLGDSRAFERTGEFFQWKHLRNPFGPSLMVVAENGVILGLRAFMRWRFRIGSRTILAVRAVDTATHPAFRRGGIFSALTRHTVDRARAEGVDLIFNTPNQLSLPGYLKLGWMYVGRPRLLVKPLRPGRIAWGLLRGAVGAGAGRSGLNVSEVPAAMRFSRPEDVESVLEEDGRHSADRIRTDRSVAFLKWRYCTAPTLPYYIHAESPQPATTVIFRPSRRRGLREILISELLLGGRDGHDISEVVQGIADAVDADYLAAHAPRDSAHERALMRAGFRPLPVVGPHFVVHPLSPEAVSACMGLGRWHLSLGDLEVF